MSRKTSDESQLKKMDKGGHLGGTTFGQAADAKTKDTRKGRQGPPQRRSQLAPAPRRNGDAARRRHRVSVPATLLPAARERAGR